MKKSQIVVGFLVIATTTTKAFSTHPFDSNLFPRSTQERRRIGMTTRNMKPLTTTTTTTTADETFPSVHGHHSGNMMIRNQMKQDGKQIPSVSITEVLVTVGILFPVWVTMIFPLTLFYQLFKGIKGRIFPQSPTFIPQSPFDSGYQITSDTMIIPRNSRTYDIVILGATGFAGKLAVRHVAKTYGVGTSSNPVKWAIAGRSKAKLEAVKTALARELNMPELQNVEIILVDTSIPSTLPNLVRDTRVVVSTAGPFWQYGSSVVEFCVKFGTHYTDITGESSWVKTMMTKWQDLAKQTGAKIISLAGHDCIPWDLSISILAKQLKEETGEDLKEVTCFVEAKSSASGGTMETLMMGASGIVPSSPVGDEDPFRYRIDGTKHSENFEANIKFYPSKITKPWDQEPTWGSPFFMSIINQDVVSWSQALRGGPPLKYSEVSVYPDMKTAFVGYFQLVLFMTAILNPITKNLLRTFVLPKPGEGPTMEDMEQKSFLTVTTKGIGSSGNTIVEAEMYFPRDAGYLDTARMVVESGLCMALEEDSLPIVGGGFFSPGFALGETLLKRLTTTGTFFSSRVMKKT